MALYKYILPTLCVTFPLTSLSQEKTETKKTETKKTTSKELEVDKKDLFSKGHTWHYEVSITVPKGKKFNHDFKSKVTEVKNGTKYTFDETQQCLGKVKIPQLKSELPVLNVFFGGKLRKRHILSMGDSQLRYHGTQSGGKDGKSIALLLPTPLVIHAEGCKIGQQWTWTEKKLPEFRFKVISTNEKIKVGDKTYVGDCIKMVQFDTTHKKVQVTKRYWFVKGIGIVKEVEKMFLPDKKAIVKTMELKSLKKLKLNKDEKFIYE